MPVQVSVQSTYPSPIAANWQQDPETGFLFCIKPSQTGNDFSLEKKKSFVPTYKSTFPDLTSALEQTGVSRRTYYWHLKFDTEFRLAVEELREEKSDKVESALFKVACMEKPAAFMDRIAFLRAYRSGLYTEKRINLTAKDIDPGTLERKSIQIGTVIDSELIDSSLGVQEAELSRPVTSAPDQVAGPQEPRPVTSSQVDSTKNLTEKNPNQ